MIPALPGVTAIALLVFASTGAPAQTYPSKALRIIIPFAPGGPTDIMGRISAERLNRTLGVPVIADNRPGAGGNIGGRQCAKAPPDGYTLCMITPSAPIAVSMVKDLGFDPVTDFAHITLIANLPSLLTVHPSLPVKNVRDLIAFAKARPDQLTFSSAGNGTSPHMMMELFKTMTGVRMTHVPYKGLAMAVVDQISGEIPVAFNTGITVVPHIQSGKLRGIATSSRERFPLLPDLPSVDESGLKGFDGGAWQGIVFPAKTPREIVMKVYGELQPMLASAETREKFLAQGAMPSGMKPEEFAAFMKNETEKWGRVAKAAGIKPE